MFVETRDLAVRMGFTFTKNTSPSLLLASFEANKKMNVEYDAYVTRQRL